MIKEKISRCLTAVQARRLADEKSDTPRWVYLLSLLGANMALAPLMAHYLQLFF